MKLLGAITRQGLPLQRHHEDKNSFEGNLYQLLILQTEDTPGKESWLHKREYILPEITNE